MHLAPPTRRPGTIAQGRLPIASPELRLLGRGLRAWADAWLRGMVVAILVAFRPQWLATCADRIHLPR